MDNNSGKVKNSVISKTTDYIENNLYEKVKLDEIAKAVGYSKYHLNRIFTESTGQTIHRYIQERRLAESALKLKNSDKQIIEIAQDAGYSSQQSYTLAFRRFYHCTPQVYRRLYTVNTQNIQFTVSSGTLHSGNSPVCLMSQGVMAA